MRGLNPTQQDCNYLYLGEHNLRRNFVCIYPFAIQKCRSWCSYLRVEATDAYHLFYEFLKEQHTKIPISISVSVMDDLKDTR